MRLKNVGFLYGGLTGKTGDDFNVEDDNESYMLFIPFTNIFNNSIINPNQLYKVKIIPMFTIRVSRDDSG